MMTGPVRHPPVPVSLLSDWSCFCPAGPDGPSALLLYCCMSVSEWESGLELKVRVFAQRWAGWGKWNWWRSDAGRLSWSQDTPLARRDMRAVWEPWRHTASHSHQWYCCSWPRSDPRPWAPRREPQWIYCQQSTGRRPAGLQSRTPSWTASPACLAEDPRWLRRRPDLDLVQSTDPRPDPSTTSSSSPQCTDLWPWLPPPPLATTNHSAPPAPPSRGRPQVRLAW